MAIEQTNTKLPKYSQIKVEDVNRLLEVGRLLYSVLTPKEVETMRAELVKYSATEEMGNTGVS